MDETYVCYFPWIKYGSTIAGEVGIIAEHTYVKKQYKSLGRCNGTIWCVIVPSLQIAIKK